MMQTETPYTAKPLLFPFGTTPAEVFSELKAYAGRADFRPSREFETRPGGLLWLNLQDGLRVAGSSLAVRLSDEAASRAGAGLIYGYSQHSARHSYYVSFCERSDGLVLAVIKYQQIIGSRYLALFTREQAAEFIGTAQP